jgi:hypothetical protein
MRLGQRISLWGLHARSRVERDDLAGTSHSDVVQIPGSDMVAPNFLVMGTAGNGVIAA